MVLSTMRENGVFLGNAVLLPPRSERVFGAFERSIYVDYKIKIYTNAKEKTMEQINDFVVAGLGIATVFVALICIIFICNIMGAIFARLADKPSKDKHSEGKSADAPVSAPSADSAGLSVPTPRYVKARLENRGAFIAAVSAVIAEDLGCDISRIRIHSVRERADAIADRGELCAAISAVIAEESGASAVRIHSIRKV